MPSSYFIYLLFRKVETFNESFKAGSYLFQEHLLLVGGEHVGLSHSNKKSVKSCSRYGWEIRTKI